MDIVQWINSTNSSDSPPSSTCCGRLGFNNVHGTSANLFKFLQNNSTTIVDLCMNDCTFESTELRLIFSIIGSNLRSMTLSDVKIIEPVKKQPLVNLLKSNMAKLRSLTLVFRVDFDFDFITTIILADRIKIMYCHDERRNHEPSDALAAFIANQRKLTMLSLVCSSQLLSKLANSQLLKFRAQNLSLESTDKVDLRMTGNCVTPDLMTLVDRQGASLVQLILNGFVLDDSQVVTLMRIQLRHLVLTNCNFFSRRQIHATSRTIEQLDFNYMNDMSEEVDEGLCNLLRCCNGLRELRLKAVIKAESISTVITNFLPKLELLKIDGIEYSPPNDERPIYTSRGF